MIDTFLIATPPSTSRSRYKIAINYDVDASSLNLFNPQPRSLGIRYTRTTYMGGGHPYNEGPYIELLWSALETETQYQSILAQAGLDTRNSGPVTCWIRDEMWNYARYNGLAVRPLIGQDANWEFFPKDITLLIKNLRLLP